MPWTPDEAERHTHKATTPELKELWAKVAVASVDLIADGMATGHVERRSYFFDRLKYRKSGGGWSFLEGMRKPSPLRK
jgi:hypothetical protein